MELSYFEDTAEPEAGYKTKNNKYSSYCSIKKQVLFIVIPLQDLPQKSLILGGDTQVIFEHSQEWNTGRLGFSAMNQ